MTGMDEQAIRQLVEANRDALNGIFRVRDLVVDGWTCADGVVTFWVGEELETEGPAIGLLLHDLEAILGVRVRVVGLAMDDRHAKGARAHSEGL